MSALPLPGDLSHVWIERFGLTCCGMCGIVRRRDRLNSTCRGLVRVSLRDSDASLAEDPKGLSGEAAAARAEGIAHPAAINHHDRIKGGD